MFQNFRMMVDSVRDVDAGVRGLLKVGVVYSNTPVVLNYLKAYHKEYPQVELYIRVGAPGDLLDDLNKGNLHVLFLRTPTEGSSDFHEKILGEDPLELVMCPELDPAPDQDSIPIELLKDVPMWSAAQRRSVGLQQPPDQRVPAQGLYPLHGVSVL